MNRKRLLTLAALVTLIISSICLPRPSTRPVAAASGWLSTAAALLALTLTWDYAGDSTGDDVGYAVGVAGDVNGDGYSDIIVGAPKDTRTTDGVDREGVAYLFHGSPAGLSHSPNWTAGSGQKGANFGASVATAGDVNNDGFDDVIVGADRYNNGQSAEGMAFVYFGSAAGLSASPGWSCESDQKDAYLGVAVGTAGDVNGDGYADVVVGAKWYSNDQTNEGRAYLFYGSAAGLSDIPDWIAEIDQAGAGFGSAVATAGDVNGDGYADVIVGAPEYDGPQQDEGAVFLFYGSAAGLSAAPDLTISGGEGGARFGAAVSLAGDINQDGYSDVIAGAPLFDTDQTDAGAAFLFLGSAAGLQPIAQQTLDISQSGSSFGGAVSPAGDVNGDGLADVLVGAKFYTNDNSREGGAFLFLGSGAGLAPTPAWRGEGNKAETEFGHAVSTAGDVNSDSYTDLVVGAPTYRIETDLRGRAFVYHGTEAISVSQFQVFLPVVLKN